MSEVVPADHTITLRFFPLLLVVLAVAAGAYAIHEHSRASRLTNENNAMSASLSATRDQLNALSAKVNAMEGPAAPAPQLATIYRRPLTAAVARHRVHHVDDPRWKKIQGQLDEQGRQIESTRADLAGTRTELQGSVAKTHDELVLLEKKGERSYYEFDLDKANQFERQGPISIRLRKANTKHDYADLELLVDDSKVSKKHVNVYEPVMFYPADEKAAVEIVINRVTKNHIHGYVSAPKYRSEELQAMANAGTTPSNTAATDPARPETKPSPVRQRLPVPAVPGR